MRRVPFHLHRISLSALAALLSLSCAPPMFAGAKKAESTASAPDRADGDAHAEQPTMGKDAGKKDDKATTWKRSTQIANTSRLMIGDREQLPIRGMQMHARIDGFRARVLIDFYFENPHSRQFEGTFKLRLPTGASPYFLAFGQSVVEDERPTMAIAMDPSDAVRTRGFEPEQIMIAREPRWQQPKEARMVPKEQAAFAYKTTVRRRVDPALLEWAGAGVFNARIFPIAPKRIHRVVIGYDMNLTRIGDDMELSLPVPADIPSTAVDIDIATLDGVQVALTPPMQGTRDNAASYYRYDNIAGQQVSVRLSGVGAIALTGDDPDTGSFFAAQVTPPLPNPARQTSAGGRHAVFLVDTSLSANPDRFNVWLALLRAILDNNRSAGLDQFAVQFFNIESLWWQPGFVANTPENVAALMAFADGLALEGATDLGAGLKEAARPAWMGGADTPRDVFLLSDGAVTWGESDAFALSTALQSAGVDGVYAYRTGMTGDDTRMLSHLARERGGAVFSVVGESEIPKASVAHRARPWRIERVRIDGASDVMIAGRPQVLFPGQRVYLVGRGAPVGDISFELAQGAGQGATRTTVKSTIAHKVDSPLSPRAYGQIAVDQLEEFLGFTDTFAESYARHFRVTGKTTSLLMLETEADYRRFGIRPQNDASVVKASPAAELLAKALKELANVLGDAKFAFLERTARKHELSSALRVLLSQLPGSAFRVDVPQLATRHHQKHGISTELRAQLEKQKPEYDTISTDAERRKREYGAADGLKSLSSLVEANPGDGVLARDIGYTAMQWGLHAHAYHLFRRVATARPFEPQTFRAMAQALAEMGKNELSIAYYEIALEGEWDARFGEFRQIVLMDYLRFLRRLVTNDTRSQYTSTHPSAMAFARSRLDELGQQSGVGAPDLLVTITWNTDNTDVDLHVIEPSGEECYYKHSRTRSGGRLTQDVTQGYGPEMYTLARAPRGMYRIRAKYFAADANRASARTKVYVSVYRYWGTAKETVQHRVVTLAYGKDMHEVFKVNVR